MTTQAPSTPDPTLRKFAVIGNPVAHSRSPFIHQAFGHQTGGSLVYDRLCAPLDNFAGTVKHFFADGGVGLNVTVPFKEQAWQMAQDGLSERARVAGAVNTLWMQDGQLKGCNTDGIGLLNDLERQGQNLAGKRILLVGAGGAAKGVVLPLLETGCARLHVVNRTVDKALALKPLSQMRRRATPIPLAPEASTRPKATGISSSTRHQAASTTRRRPCKAHVLRQTRWPTTCFTPPCPQRSCAGPKMPGRRTSATGWVCWSGRPP